MQRVQWITDPGDWQKLALDWNRLADGSPCMNWEWLDCWWRHYGSGKLLLVGVLVDEQGRLLAGLPCYWERSTAHGRLLRMVGSGKVCSDFVGLICRSGMEREAQEAFAQALMGDHLELKDGSLRWDEIDWDGLSGLDRATTGLLDRLESEGCARKEAGRINTWRIEIQSDWEAQLALLGKRTRRKVRVLQRNHLETGEVRFHESTDSHLFERGQEVLIELHQRRWTSIGQSGCFSDPVFTAFYREAARRLFEQGKWTVRWLESEGVPIAAHTGFWVNNTLFIYQTGNSPEHSEMQPGWLLIAQTLHQAVKEGWSAIDFMRGDEDYKEMLRAEGELCSRQLLAHPRWQSRTRFQTYQWAYETARGIKHWVRGSAVAKS